MQVARLVVALVGISLVGANLALSACASRSVITERPDAMPGVEVGGALAGGAVTQDEWDDMVSHTTQSAVKVVISDCSNRELGSGSGFNIGRFVVTNRHVVEDARRITVIAPDGTKTAIASWAIGDRDDLALLAPTSPLGKPAVPMATKDPVSGDIVASVGFPLGASVTTRKARVLERLRDQDLSDTFALSTTASVQPGDSGGVLVDARGEVVAVTTAIALKDNVSLAVPVSRVRELARNPHLDHSSAACP